MIVKRNIKVRTTTQNSSTNQTEQPKLVSLGLGRYFFPKCDEVPPGIYFSKIIHADYTVTRKGKHAVEVFYIMRDANNCKAVMNGWHEGKTRRKKYYIKQVYPQSTQYYKDFEDSMAEALGVKKNVPFGIKDTIGQTELVNLSYDIGVDIGGFEWRIPYTEEEFIVYPEEETDEETADEDTGEYSETVEDETEEIVEREMEEAEQEYDELVADDVINGTEYNETDEKKLEYDEEFDDFLDDWV